MEKLGMLFLVLAVSGRHSQGIAMQEERTTGFRWIDKSEAFRLMKQQSNYRIVDVRSREEYMGGHLPKAINLPVGDVEEECLDTIPNLNQIIFVYCASGTRSKQACEIMVNLGYTNVYGFGGFQ